MVCYLLTQGVVHDQTFPRFGRSALYRRIAYAVAIVDHCREQGYGTRVAKEHARNVFAQVG